MFLEHFEIEQIGVARDDQIDASAQSDRQHFIVIRVATDWPWQGCGCDDFCKRLRIGQSAFSGRVRSTKNVNELGALEHIREFGQKCRTADERERAIADVLDQGVRRSLPQQAGDEDVRINDRSHAACARRAPLSLQR
jgi:hypothetical protein